MNLKLKNSARRLIQQLFKPRLALFALLLAVAGLLAPGRALEMIWWKL